METIRIAFIEGDEEILHINAPSQPFKVGENITLSVKVKNKEKWDVEGVTEQSYSIQEIESSVSIAYVDRIHEYISFFIYVRKV